MKQTIAFPRDVTIALTIPTTLSCHLACGPTRQIFDPNTTATQQNGYLIGVGVEANSSSKVRLKSGCHLHPGFRHKGVLGIYKVRSSTASRLFDSKLP